MPDGLIPVEIPRVSTCIVGSPIAFVDTRAFSNLRDLLDTFTAAEVYENIRSINLRDRFGIQFKYEDRFDVYLGNIENSEIKVAFMKKIIEKLYDYKGKIDVSSTARGTFASYE